jgi:hypothetical protein
MRICLNCKKELKRKRFKKFCCLNCRIEYKRNRNIRNCIKCGEILNKDQGKYCSRRCRFEYEAEHIEDFKDFYKKRSSKNIGREKTSKEVICLNCNKLFKWKYGNTKAKFCSNECVKEYWRKNDLWKKYHKPSKKCLENISIRKYFKKYCKQCGKGMDISHKFCCSHECFVKYKRENKEKFRYIYDKISETQNERSKNGEYIERNRKSSERMKANNPSFDPEVVKKQRASLNKLYEDHPEKLLERKTNWLNAPLRGKGFEGRQPTKLEKAIIELNLNNTRFTGDGKFWLTFKNGKHKNPDFKIKGQRKVIEVGDTQYWHTLEEIEEVKKCYTEINYECLYLTDVDIYKKWEESKEKVLEFVKDIKYGT